MYGLVPKQRTRVPGERGWEFFICVWCKLMYWPSNVNSFGLFSGAYSTPSGSDGIEDSTMRFHRVE